MDRPEPPAQSADRTSSTRQRRANRAVLTAQCGCPGFQGLPAERQRMVHSGSRRRQSYALGTTPPAPAQQRRPELTRAAHTGELWKQQALRKDRQTMGRAPPLGPASRPGTRANPGRNPGPAPQKPGPADQTRLREPGAISQQPRTLGPGTAQAYLKPEQPRGARNLHPAPTPQDPTAIPEGPVPKRRQNRRYP